MPIPGNRTKFIILAIMLMLVQISCRKQDDKPSKTEFYLINNTHHALTLHCRAENPDRDTMLHILAHARISILEIEGIYGHRALKPFLERKVIKIMDENNLDWWPRIKDADKWGHIRLPEKEGARQLFFMQMNPLDDGMNRLQSLGNIKLFRISQGLAYLVILSSVLGLLYVRLRYKSLYILLAIFLNFPVIYYTADFGFVINYVLDPLFILPTWIVESTPYFVRFSLPVGAMIVWVVLILRKLLKRNTTS